MQTTSIITCPYCGHKQKEEMPIGSCVPFYICKNCKKTLTPKNKDCCVFCSYGDTKCPDKQQIK